MPKTLLLVEDSFTIQNVVETTFTSTGYQVVIANDAREGLSKLASDAPDIILADASLPEMDGFQLCQAIRATRGYEHAPVLLLTSQFTDYDEEMGKRAGVTDTLAKPFDAYTLLTLVNRLLAEATLPPGYLDPEVNPSPAGTESSAGSASPATAQDAMPPVYQELNTTLATIVQDTVQSHLVTLLDALTPHIVASVRSTIEAQLPSLLEDLLKKEIDQLKREAAQDDSEAPSR